jgi:hypothetical protein
MGIHAMHKIHAPIYLPTYHKLTYNSANRQILCKLGSDGNNLLVTDILTVK